MLLAFFSGAAIGMERSAKNRPAGFRTHILVCVGAAVASLSGHYIYLVLMLPSDPTRLAAQVVTGLGFIGAGTIIVTRRQSVKGLTTAAGLWATGIIGLAFGAGYYEGGLFAVLLVLFTEIVFSRVSKRIKHVPAFGISLLYSEKSTLDRVMRCCKDHNIGITNLQIISSEETMPDGQTGYAAELTLRAIGGIEPDSFLEYILEISGVISAKVKDITPENPYTEIRSHAGD